MDRLVLPSSLSGGIAESLVSPSLACGAFANGTACRSTIVLLLYGTVELPRLFSCSSWRHRDLLVSSESVNENCMEH